MLVTSAGFKHFIYLLDRTLYYHAAHLETHLDLDRILSLAEPV
jgi:hypothetical protein